MKLEVHCRVHKNRSLVSVLSQINPVMPIYRTSSRSILISHIRSDIFQVFLPLGFLTKILYDLFFFSTCTTHTTHLILSDDGLCSK